MEGIGDGIVVLFAAVAVVYGIVMVITKKLPLYFQLSVAAVACLMLGYLFDICDYMVNGVLEGGYVIGCLGSIGSFLFLLTASIGYIDGIIDDGSPAIKKCRVIALIAPALVLVLWGINMIANVSMDTKAVYTALWIPAAFSSYFNLKHAIIPDFDFGFIKAIKPYNIFLLLLSFSELLCLTAWDYYYPVQIAITAITFGILCICTMVVARKGVEKWTI